MSVQGFLQPNPVLFNLETLKPKARLGHEHGLGAECVRCGAGCPGFQLHFWRKVCHHCRCGKVEHRVVEEDHGSHYVGKLFDRPLRSQAEERTFIYGELFDADPVANVDCKEVLLDWAPAGLPSYISSAYLRSLPEGHVSLKGSEGAVRRKKQLEKQFPLHDVEPGQCHQLSQGEMDSMSSYVDDIKINIAGQGSVRQLGENISQKYSPVTTARHFRDRTSPSPPPPLPPPPMSLLNTDTLSYTLARTHLITQENITPPTIKMHLKDQNKRQFLPPKFRKGSTGSSITSSPSPPPISPTLSPWSCSGCRGEMYPGEIAVFAGRAAHNACWHSNCFSCTKCGEMLEDLLYFYKDGKLFCGRDFAEMMNIPRCAACDELIFSSQYTLAEDRVWHEDHFCCWTCDQPLAGHAYIPVDGQPYCMGCWQGRYGKQCTGCGENIYPQDQRVQLGEECWHASGECFKCGVCWESLMGGRVSRRRGVLVCSEVCGEVVSNSWAGTHIKTHTADQSPDKDNNKKVSYYATDTLHARKHLEDMFRQNNAQACTGYSTIV